MNSASSSDTVHIVFTPSGKRGQVALGKSVLEAAQQLGVDLDTVLEADEADRIVEAFERALPG